jgi:hypothetical protein
MSRDRFEANVPPERVAMLFLMIKLEMQKLAAAHGYESSALLQTRWFNGYLSGFAQWAYDELSGDWGALILRTAFQKIHGPAGESCKVQAYRHLSSGDEQTTLGMTAGHSDGQRAFVALMQGLAIDQDAFFSLRSAIRGKLIDEQKNFEGAT